MLNTNEHVLHVSLQDGKYQAYELNTFEVLFSTLAA